MYRTGALRFAGRSRIICALPLRPVPIPPRSALRSELKTALKVVASTPPPAAARAPAPPEATDYCRLLQENMGAVGDAVRFVASRYRLSTDMTEELNSRALLHLVDHDYAVLRQWRRECSLQTYLTTVIGRVFLDLRNKEWGKAKPPAIARRLGPLALMLWRLTHRSRLSFDEAVKTLQAEHQAPATRDELWDIYVKLPAPSGRYFVGVTELAETEQAGGDAEVLVEQIERRRLAGKVERGLASALAGLGDEDRLILKLFFHDNLFLAEVARLLHIDQPRLYPRFRGLMARLRTALEAQGLSVEDTRAIIGEVELGAGQPLLAHPGKRFEARPSL